MSTINTLTGRAVGSFSNHQIHRKFFVAN